MHPLCFAGLSLVLFIFSSLERSTHDAGTVQSSDLRTLRRKLKNQLLQCFGRTLCKLFTSSHPPIVLVLFTESNLRLLTSAP